MGVYLLQLLFEGFKFSIVKKMLAIYLVSLANKMFNFSFVLLLSLPLSLGLLYLPTSC